MGPVVVVSSHFASEGHWAPDGELSGEGLWARAREYDSPTNWIIADNDMVSRGDWVVLIGGRVVRIVGVSGRGWPMVSLEDGSDWVEVHHRHIARRRQ